MKFLSESPEQTMDFAARFAARIKPGTAVLLQGGIGAGKTVFAKGFAAGLNITDEITSPTYVYMNDYGGKLYHFDFYRIENAQAAVNLGLDEYFYAGGICLIEWPENVREILPDNSITVKIVKKGEFLREIEVL